MYLPPENEARFIELANRFSELIRRHDFFVNGVTKENIKDPVKFREAIDELIDDARQTRAEMLGLFETNP